MKHNFSKILFLLFNYGGTKERRYIYGLDGDFERKPMGKILDLIPVCDSIMKLNGKWQCVIQVNLFFTELQIKTIVFDHEEYVPLCRNVILGKIKNLFNFLQRVP